jgi:tetratricopeptide (TPR) repeat protein
MKKVIFLFLILFTTTLQAEDAKMLFAEANKAYEANDYELAIEKYEAVLSQKKESASLFFNLGNAYYKNQQLGKAILNYEKAKVLNPNLADLEENLDIAENRKKDNIPSLPPFFLATFWQGFYLLASSAIWAILGILMLFVSVGGMTLFLLKNTKKEKKTGLIALGVGFLLGILFLTLGNSRYQYMTNQTTAVITTSKVDFKDGADEDSNTTQPLHEGTVIHLIENIGNWYKVRLPNGEVGWLPKEVFEVV